ncbi:MAG: uncharacterized protein JWM09_272 [Francisellaceae bacterium]|nr:uncharacterized protein [Francisellaceae bacterium]
MALRFSNNGSNIRKFNRFTDWPKHLLNVTKSFENVILVGHSFGGYLILSEPLLEKHVKAFVLMNTLPISPYKIKPSQPINQNVNIDVNQKLKIYEAAPSDKAAHTFLVETSDLYFMEPYRSKGKALLKKTYFNHRSFEGLRKYFALNFKAKFVPKIPTLILGGVNDTITPLSYFLTDPRFKKENFSIMAIKDAGHFGYVENQKAYAQSLEEFINRL